MGIKISELPLGTANVNSIVPATNAAGNLTEKITLGDIANLKQDWEEAVFSLNSFTATAGHKYYLAPTDFVVVEGFDVEDPASSLNGEWYFFWNQSMQTVRVGGVEVPTGRTVVRYCEQAGPGAGTWHTAPSSAGGLSDSSTYILCKTGDDIAAKYAAAKLLTPGGNALSATNRAYLVIMPGVYPLTAQWEIDAEFVDVIGLGSSALERGCVVAVTTSGDYDINVSANNVRITGIGTQPEGIGVPTNIKTVGGKPLQVFERCISPGTTFAFYGEGGFGSGDGSISGTFVNCMAGNNSFGGLIPGMWGEPSASGTFINCTGGNGSFGGKAATGMFTNCTGGIGSFGSFGGGASGSFNNCVGGDASFGGGENGGAEGYFVNCTAGGASFGTSGYPGGTLIGCRLTSGSFPPPTGSGKQRFCLDGSYTIVNAG